MKLGRQVRAFIQLYRIVYILALETASAPSVATVSPQPLPLLFFLLITLRYHHRHFQTYQRGPFLSFRPSVQHLEATMMA